MPGAEVLRKAPAQALEEPHAETPTDGVPDGVADDRADGRRGPHAHRADVEGVVGGQQSRADEGDLTGQRDAQALQADHETDHEVDREGRNGLEQRVHGQSLAGSGLASLIVSGVVPTLSVPLPALVTRTSAPASST